MPEAGVVVGTTGLNIRECPDVSCGSEGWPNSRIPIIVTGPEENGFVPVEWAGKSGWAWNLYVETPSRGTPFLESRDAGLQTSRVHLRHRYWRTAADTPAPLAQGRKRSRHALPDGLVGAGIPR